VQALVLCPTRELALQVTRELEALAKHRGVRCERVYGGAPMARQVNEIRGGAQIVVGTPGACSITCIERRWIPHDPRARARRERRDAVDGFLAADLRHLSFCRPRADAAVQRHAAADIRRVAETRLRRPSS
jgi:hypothetical protein